MHVLRERVAHADRILSIEALLLLTCNYPAVKTDSISIDANTDVYRGKYAPLSGEKMGVDTSTQ